MTPTITRYAPEPAPIGLAEVERWLALEDACLSPFAPETLAFFGAWSDALLALPAARAHGELQALAFWMRPAALNRLAAEFRARAPGDGLCVPRGVVFHVPPANVDTMFVYSWLLSALMGNRNVLRLSSRGHSPQVALLLDSLNGLLRRGEFGAIARSTLVVGYGHEAEPSRLLSGACDLRVVWGGDASIAALRTFPLAPHATELTFPDRFSLAALHAPTLLDLGEAGILELARRFFQDAYAFDQRGCASPRLIAWCGSAQEVEAAGSAFYRTLADVVDARRYQPEPAIATGKLLALHQATLDHPIQRVRHFGPAVTVATLDGLPDIRALRPGGGFFFETRLRTLTDLVPFVQRKDQTLGHAGFEPDDLWELASALNGRGLDRLVPLGQALQFDPVWDGVDLLDALSRIVTVRPGAPVTTASCVTLRD